MKRIKSRYIILVLLVCIIYNTKSKAATYQLITENETLQNLPAYTSINPERNLLPVRRSRNVSLTPAITQELNVLSGDNIILNLFADTNYAASIDKVSSNPNHTVMIKGTIEAHPYSELFICKTNENLFVNIDIPDESKRFIIRTDSESGSYNLMEINTSQLPFEDGTTAMTGLQKSLDTQIFAGNQLETNSEEPVSIDIMIVYTPAAYEDAAFYFSGIDNYIAYLMNEANTTLERSQLNVTLNLVHSTMVDYVENKTAYKYDPILGDITKGSLYAALRHLSEKDSYMEEVSDLREQYGADLVTLLVSGRILLNNNNIAGLATQLTNPSGNPDEAFSVILTEYLNYTFIHEIGHIMGCGHSKYQMDYNYGGLFEYSYGWRWSKFCSVMSYPDYTYTRINLFSNPDIIYDHLQTGDYDEADNARTIRQTSHAIAAYRPHVDINDVNVPEHIPAVIYVDINAPSGGNGHNWDTAYNVIGDALLAAKSNDEIWIAKGTYKPTDGNEDIENRTKVFILKDGVSVYGGFDGTETKRDQRNWIENKTILSGDIGISQKSRDNSYRVLLGAENSVLDGFIITQSYGDSAFYNKEGDGGGIYFDNVNNITISNCIFRENYSINGSSVFIRDCNLVSIENCTFENNSAQNKGTLYAFKSSVSISGCEFYENISGYSGGAIEFKRCDANITNCLFVKNSAECGGAAEIWDSNAVVMNCTFAGNSAETAGGALESDNKTIVTNSIFWNNTVSEISGNPKVNYTNIKGGWEGSGEGNIDVEPLFADPNKYDYHLKSQVGRWDPNDRVWLKDDVTSLCIDAGDPNSGLNVELWPHGNRINIGAYGGTSQASMSLSDIGDCRDLNNDDLITLEDILLLTKKWDSNDVPLKQDLNLDGIVDINDLAFYEDWSTDSNNTAPVFDSIQDKHIAAGNELSFSISAIDADSDGLGYEVLGLPEGAEFTNQIFTWTPEQAGAYPITIIVSDYKSLDYKTINIIVESDK